MKRKRLAYEAEVPVNGWKDWGATIITKYFQMGIWYINPASGVRKPMRQWMAKSLPMQALAQ